MPCRKQSLLENTSYLCRLYYNQVGDIAEEFYNG